MTGISTDYGWNSWHYASVNPLLKNRAGVRMEYQSPNLLLCIAKNTKIVDSHVQGYHDLSNRQHAPLTITPPQRLATRFNDNFNGNVGTAGLQMQSIDTQGLFVTDVSG